MQFFDLPDYLSYLSTRIPSRSSCSLTCKFSYTPHRGGWDDAFFTRIGLDELRAGGYKQVGGAAEPPLTAGTPVGKGLSETAAGELGLKVGTPVGSALIDAFGVPFSGGYALND
jgi:ribulose kinase